MPGLLDGQRVLVVGTGPMAQATAAAAASSGATVFLSGRDRARTADAAARAGLAPESALTADPTDPRQARQLIEHAGTLDHLAVLAGGTGARASSLITTPLPDAQAAFGRFWLSYNLLQAAHQHIGDSITLLSGSSSRRPVAGLGIWGTLHASIEALARNAALELSPIRVNTISPGGIGMHTDRQLTPHRGQPTDIAAAAIALMTNPAITGAVMDVYGGERLGAYSSE